MHIKIKIKKRREGEAMCVILLITTSLTFDTIKRDFIVGTSRDCSFILTYRFSYRLTLSWNRRILNTKQQLSLCSRRSGGSSCPLSPSLLSNPDPDSGFACRIFRAICVDGFVSTSDPMYLPKNVFIQIK